MSSAFAALQLPTRAWRSRKRTGTGLLKESIEASRWSLDFISAVFLSLTATLIAASPGYVGAGWVGAEILFYVWLTNIHAPKLSASNHVSRACSQLREQGSQLFDRLLDETEGAVHLFKQYPHHLLNWFIGDTQQLGLHEVSELLDQLLLSGNGRQLPESGHQESLAQYAESFMKTLGLEQHISIASSTCSLHAIPAPAVQAVHSTSTAISTSSPVLADSSTQSLAAAAATAAALSLQTSNTWSRLLLRRRRLQQVVVQQKSARVVDKARPLAAAEQPLLACYRPLLFYLLMEGVAAWSHVSLTLRQGFKLVKTSPVATYYVRQGTDTTAPPLVFLHGIGAGLAAYVPFLNRLAGNTNRTIIAVQYKHVSMRITARVPSTQQVAQDIEMFLASQNIDKVSLAAHSYGTMVASCLLKSARDVIAELTLLDPVCFAMFLPHLIRNAMFFHLSSANSTAQSSSSAGSAQGLKRRILRSMMRGVIVRDVHVAAALSRDTHWAHLNLWTTDLPQIDVPTRVMLSANDNLVPVQEVATLLTTGVAAERGVAVTVFPGVGHGSFLVNKHVQDTVMAALTGNAPVSPSTLSVDDSGVDDLGHKDSAVPDDLDVALTGMVLDTSVSTAMAYGSVQDGGDMSEGDVQEAQSVHAIPARRVPVALFGLRRFNKRRGSVSQVVTTCVLSDTTRSAVNASTCHGLNVDSDAWHAQTVPVSDAVNARSGKQHVRLLLPHAAPISGFVRMLRSRVFNRAQPVSSSGKAKPRAGRPRWFR